ncbi:MAG: response regulator [Colwellia sp.]
MSKNAKPLNVLVIESNGTRRGVMLSMLRAMGFNNVFTENNEVNCFHLIASEKIGLIICSWDLSQFNAINLLKKIRAEEKTAKLPFVIVSTVIEQDKIKEAILNGVSEYIVPPFNLLIFETRINRAIKTPLSKAAILNKNNALVSNRANQGRNQNRKPKLSVLVVDDVVDNIEIIKDVISSDYHVKATTNAKSALQVCLSEQPPDLILLDIMMPEIDGLTLCKKLKSTPETQNIAIIFLTALAEDKDVVKGLSLGAVDYITKPINPPILLARMHVHASLILNQLSIQNQIDDMLYQNKLNNSFSLVFQENIQRYIKKSNEATQRLIEHFSSQTHISHQIEAPLNDLKINLEKGKLFIEDISLLNKLQNQNFSVDKTEVHLKETLSFVIERFKEVSHDKSLNIIVEMENELKASVDVELIDNLLSTLYAKALEESAVNSNVTVTGKELEHCIIVDIHFENEMALEVIDYIERFDINTTLKADYNIWLYLTLYIVKEMNSSFYYHSSKSNGTSFYIKLPNAH